MTTALYVTTKQFCKRAWLGALLAVSTLVLLPLVFRALMSLKKLDGYGVSGEPFDYYFAFLGMSWIFFFAICMYALRDCEKTLFRLPVSSTRIFSGLVLLTAGAVMLLDLVTNGCYRILFFDQRWIVNDWPVLGPLLFLMTLLITCHALYWSRFSLSFTFLFVWGSLVAGLFYWFCSRYFPNGFHEASVPWRHVSFSDAVIMLGASSVAWYQGSRVFGKVRSGTAIPSRQWQQAVVWWNGLLTGNCTTPASSQSALARLHWSDSCRRPVVFAGLYLGMLGILLSFILFLWRAGSWNPLVAYLNSIGNVTCVLCLLAAVFAGFLLGDGINNTGRTELKNYLGGAPLSDNAFSGLLMRNLVKSVGLTYGLLLLSCLLSHAAMILYFGANGHVLTMQYWEIYVSVLSTQSGPFLCFTSAVFWGISTTLVSILWTGRTWFYFALIVIFGGLCVSFILISSFMRTESITGLLQGYLLFLSACILGGTLTAFVVALKNELITRLTILGAVLFCLFSGWFAWSLSANDYKSLFYSIYNSNFFFQETGENGLRFFVFVLLTTLVAPFATIPLAISWNRHR
ncbi:hypothetical protein Enr10x_57200 [Gimesia panareensis]|uniref:Uncharacterized protein n=1 Tax=Gimesia panareensis TaxID=2527978 RepID=A0A517QFG4_9PLAN|nr:hypothetical protein [Gimesia panareensis]QDT30354.1 hypothetical protein Enr10x_57200 [Gimesia panareensis]